VILAFAAPARAPRATARTRTTAAVAFTNHLCLYFAKASQTFATGQASRRRRVVRAYDAPLEPNPMGEGSATGHIHTVQPGSAMQAPGPVK
jgi:hypothetical protein